MIECVLCGHLIDRKMHEGKVYWTEGNNAQPLADGRCCDMCDCILVIPSRMGMYLTSDKTAAILGMSLYRQRVATYKDNNITNEEE